MRWLFLPLLLVAVFLCNAKPDYRIIVEEDVSKPDDEDVGVIKSDYGMKARQGYAGSIGLGVNAGGGVGGSFGFVPAHSPEPPSTPPPAPPAPQPVVVHHRPAVVHHRPGPSRPILTRPIAARPIPIREEVHEVNNLCYEPGGYVGPGDCDFNMGHVRNAPNTDDDETSS